MEFLDLKNLDAGWNFYYFPEGMKIGYGVAPLSDDKRFVILGNELVRHGQNSLTFGSNRFEKVVFNVASGDF